MKYQSDLREGYMLSVTESTFITRKFFNLLADLSDHDILGSIKFLDVVPIYKFNFILSNDRIKVFTTE